jgi:hypothetical protein
MPFGNGPAMPPPEIPLRVNPTARPINRLISDNWPAVIDEDVAWTRAFDAVVT